MNYLSRAIIEVAESCLWRTQSTKGNYRVEMKYDGYSMMCGFYHNNNHIGDWDSLDKTITLADDNYKKQIIKAIESAGYQVNIIN